MLTKPCISNTRYKKEGKFTKTELYSVDLQEESATKNLDISR